MERINYIKHTFIDTLLVARKWEVIINRIYPDSDLTVRQFIMIIIAANTFDYNPSIKDISTVMATSHQNTKALLLQLEKKGFVTLYKDSKDNRVWRVNITDSKEGYWEAREKKDLETLLDLFSDISDESLQITYETMKKLDEKATRILEF
ncbi:MAG: hypothetical protein PF505_13205 [Vallitaleaceae bacterium]|nr:hypothetical protein [Vallitaleaceae bacterium]